MSNNNKKITAKSVKDIILDKVQGLSFISSISDWTSISSSDDELFIKFLLTKVVEELKSNGIKVTSSNSFVLDIENFKEINSKVMDNTFLNEAFNSFVKQGVFEVKTYIHYTNLEKTGMFKFTRNDIQKSMVEYGAQRNLLNYNF